MIQHTERETIFWPSMCQPFRENNSPWARPIFCDYYFDGICHSASLYQAVIGWGTEEPFRLYHSFISSISLNSWKENKKRNIHISLSYRSDSLIFFSFKFVPLIIFLKKCFYMSHLGWILDSSVGCGCKLPHKADCLKSWDTNSQFT